MGWPSRVSIHCGLNSIHFIVKLFKNDPFQIDHQSLEHLGGGGGGGEWPVVNWNTRGSLF